MFECADDDGTLISTELPYWPEDQLDGGPSANEHLRRGGYRTHEGLTRNDLRRRLGLASASSSSLQSYSGSLSDGHDDSELGSPVPDLDSTDSYASDSDEDMVTTDTAALGVPPFLSSLEAARAAAAASQVARVNARVNMLIANRQRVVPD
jgi:hypothetical protein